MGKGAWFVLMLGCLAVGALTAELLREPLPSLSAIPQPAAHDLQTMADAMLVRQQGLDHELQLWALERRLLLLENSTAPTNRELAWLKQELLTLQQQQQASDQRQMELEARQRIQQESLFTQRCAP